MNVRAFLTMCRRLAEQHAAGHEVDARAFCAVHDALCAFELATADGIDPEAHEILQRVDAGEFDQMASEQRRAAKQIEARAHTLHTAEGITEARQYMALFAHGATMAHDIGQALERAKAIKAIYTPPYEVKRSGAELATLYTEHRIYFSCSLPEFMALFARTATAAKRVRWTKQTKQHKTDFAALVRLLDGITTTEATAEQIARYFDIGESITTAKLKEARRYNKKQMLNC